MCGTVLLFDGEVNREVKGRGFHRGSPPHAEDQVPKHIPQSNLSEHIDSESS